MIQYIFTTFCFPTNNKGVIHYTWWSWTNKIVEAPFNWFLWVILPNTTIFCFRRYYLFICWVFNSWFDAMTIISHMINYSWILYSLFFLFSTSSILLFSLNCKYSLSFLYLFIGMTSAIGVYAVSLAQYIIYNGRSTSDISIYILINCLISSSAVAILFPSFWMLYKLVCSAMSLLGLLFQSIWK